MAIITLGRKQKIEALIALLEFSSNTITTPPSHQSLEEAAQQLWENNITLVSEADSDGESKNFRGLHITPNYVLMSAPAMRAFIEKAKSDGIAIATNEQTGYGDMHYNEEYINDDTGIALLHVDRTGDPKAPDISIDTFFEPTGRQNLTVVGTRYDHRYEKFQPELIESYVNAPYSSVRLGDKMVPNLFEIQVSTESDLDGYGVLDDKGSMVGFVLGKVPGASGRYTVAKPSLIRKGFNGISLDIAKSM